MALDVKINIKNVVPAGTTGFGCPLILEQNAKAGTDYAEISSLSALDEKGYTADSAVYKTAQLMFMQEHAPKKIAVASCTTTAVEWLNVESNMSKGWRQLVVLNGGENGAEPADIAPVIEAQTKYPKMYYANCDLNGNAIAAIKDCKRTVLCFYTPTEDIPCPAAAIVGEVAGLEVGSYTVNNMTVKGIEGLDLSDDEVKAIHDKGGITYVVSAGDVVASEGFTVCGEFIDNMDGDDYIRTELEYKTQKVFNNNLKVPYTNVGIAMLESAAIDVMTDAQNKGIVDTFTVQYALREEIAESDRISRNYFGGNIKYERAGAIHNIEINCEASV